MLILFFGPPEDPGRDHEAVSSFMGDEGDKIILGGTTCTIFERQLKSKVNIDLKTAGSGLLPYGFLDNILVTEGTLTLQTLNNVFTDNYRNEDAVELLKDMISKHDEIKIYHGRAVNPVNGIDKNAVFAEFVRHLQESGIEPEIVNF